jgi:hypothetical protein
MAYLGGPQGLPPWDAQPIRIADPPPGGIPPDHEPGPRGRRRSGSRPGAPRRSPRAAPAPRRSPRQVRSAESSRWWPAKRSVRAAMVIMLIIAAVVIIVPIALVVWNF